MLEKPRHADTPVRLGIKTKKYEQALQGSPRRTRSAERSPSPTCVGHAAAAWVVSRMAEVARMSSRQRWTLVLVCTAAFMLLLDITIVSVALPSIPPRPRRNCPPSQPPPSTRPSERPGPKHRRHDMRAALKVKHLVDLQRGRRQQPPVCGHLVPCASDALSLVIPWSRFSPPAFRRATMRPWALSGFAPWSLQVLWPCGRPLGATPPPRIHAAAAIVSGSSVS